MLEGGEAGHPREAWGAGMREYPGRGHLRMGGSPRGGATLVETTARKTTPVRHLERDAWVGHPGRPPEDGRAPWRRSLGQGSLVGRRIPRDGPVNGTCGGVLDFPAPDLCSGSALRYSTCLVHCTEQGSEASEAMTAGNSLCVTGLCHEFYSVFCISLPNQPMSSEIRVWCFTSACVEIIMANVMVTGPCPLVQFQAMYWKPCWAAPL